MDPFSWFWLAVAVLSATGIALVALNLLLPARGSDFPDKSLAEPPSASDSVDRSRLL